MNKINIGCGRDYLEGYKNIDISKEVKADEYYDVTKGIKEKDDSIDEVFTGCMIEQVETNKEFVFVMNEFHRVLKKDGVLRGYVPSPDFNTFCIDPMDKRFFTEDTFKYFDGDEHHWKEFGRSYGFKPWKVIKVDKAINSIIHFEMQPVK